MHLDGQARRQEGRTADAAGDTDAYPPLLTASRRFSHLFTLLFTRKSECMKLAAYPPQPIHPLSACTTRPPPFHSPHFHIYIFHAGYYTLFTYSLTRSLLAFPGWPRRTRSHRLRRILDRCRPETRATSGSPHDRCADARTWDCPTGVVGDGVAYCADISMFAEPAQGFTRGPLRKTCDRGKRDAVH